MKKLLIFAVLLIFSTVHADENEWYLYKTGEWTPSAKTLSIIKKNLKAFVEPIAISQMQPISNWSEYIFQYFGTVQDGERVVEIHAFCSIENPNKLNQELIMVLDGGSCYFQLLYNPSSKQFTDLQINGEA